MTEALVELVKHGSLVHVDQALGKLGKDVNRCNSVEVYPLHVAVWRNHLPIIERLLKAGASPDTADGESGWTALHRALYCGHLSAAARLLTAGASVDAADFQGRTPVDLVSSELQGLPHHGTSHGRVIFSWGSGANYQLGTGSTDFHEAPVRVEALVGLGVVALAAAKFHSAALTSDGRLYTWGWGRGGRLGHPDFHIHSGESALIQPWQVGGLGKRHVLSVAAGKHHMVCATSSGELFTWGSNRDGKLGYAAGDTQPTPRKVELKGRVVMVAAANKHSAAITSAGEAFTWGANGDAQLGYGTTPNASNNPLPRLVDALKGKSLVAVAAAKCHTAVLTAEGEAWTWGHKVVTPRRVNLVGVRDTARAGPGAASGQAVPSSSSGAGSNNGGGQGAAGPTAGAASSSGLLQQQGGEVRFHRHHNEVVRPLATMLAAGFKHTSVVTRTGSVLTWYSADPALRAQEVLGPLAGKRIVGISANKTRTAVCTADGDVYVWEDKGLQPVPGVGASSSQQQAQGSSAAVAAPGSGSGGAGSSGTEPLPPILPIRVLGVKHVSHVAVGEKHSMALQSWTQPPMPDKRGAMPQLPRARRGSNSSVSDGSLSGDDDPFAASGRALQASFSGRSPSAWGYDGAAATHGSPSPLLGTSPSMYGRSWGAGASPQASPFGGSSLGRTGLMQSPALAAGVRGLAGAAGTHHHHHRPAPPYDWAAVFSAVPQHHDSDPQDAGSPRDAAEAGPSSPQWRGQQQQQGAAIESLQVLCQRSVAAQLVEPRTALAILEYADVAGAALLRCYCLAVALANLDCIVLEAPGSLVGLPQHLGAELEHLYRTALLAFGQQGPGGAGGGQGTSGNAVPVMGSSYDGGAGALRPGSLPRDGASSRAAAVMGSSPQPAAAMGSLGGMQGSGGSAHMLEAFHAQRALLSKLQPGRRPTAAPAWLGGEPTTSLIQPQVGSRLAAAAQAALGAIGHAVSSGTAASAADVAPAADGSAPGDGDEAQQLQLDEAAQKLLRTLERKLQQIECLAEQERAGRQLDAQQHAKMGQRGALQDARRALAAGVPVEQVRQVMEHAADVAAKLITAGSEVETPAGAASALPAAAAGGRSQQSQSQLARQPSQRVASRTAQAQLQQQALAGVTGKGQPAAENAAPSSGRANIAAGAQVESAAPRTTSANQQGWSGPGNGAPPQDVAPTPSSRAAGPAAPEAATPTSGSGSSKKQQRRGGLSMFLKGALDKPAPAPPPVPAASPAVPKGPAWGGAGLQAVPLPPGSGLRELLGQQQQQGAMPQQAAGVIASSAGKSKTPGAKIPDAALPAMAPQVLAQPFGAMFGGPATGAGVSIAAAAGGPAGKLLLADFIGGKPAPKPAITKAASSDKDTTAAPAAPAPAWSGQSALLGSSPPGRSLMASTSAVASSCAGSAAASAARSLRDIQAEQERQRVAAATNWARATASSATSATLSSSAGGAAVAAGAGSSSSAMLMGSSPPGHGRHAAPSKWYVPETAQPQAHAKALMAIQVEEKAMKELKALYRGRVEARLVPVPAPAPASSGGPAQASG